MVRNQLELLMKDEVYASWHPFFKQEMEKPYFAELDAFVSSEMKQHTVFPPVEDIFNAFIVPADAVKLVILGQDPYHEQNQAMGYSFSVRDNVPAPPSLRNILKELKDDAQANINPDSHDLTPWVKQNVLLLNTVLTVNEGQANSHANAGWKQFTDNALQYMLKQSDQAIVAILWGKSAQQAATFFEKEKERRPIKIISSAHPSPLSAYRGFFGSKPFSKANDFLTSQGIQPIDWQL